MKNKISKIMRIGTIGALTLVAVIMVTNQSCSSATYNSRDNKMEKIIESDQYKEGKFINYKDGFEMNFLKNLGTMWDFIFADNDRTPEVELPRKEVDFEIIRNANKDELKITWVGHSSQIINIDGRIVLTDPMYDKTTAFMGPSRYNGELPFRIQDLPEIDLVVISHNHYDHLNSTSIEKIHHKVKIFLVPLMVGAQLEEFGVPREKIIEMDWWDEITLFDDFLIAFTPAQHFSGRGLFDKDETLWGSFVIKGPHHNIYFSGDSGYFEGFKLIGDKYGPFDYTFMECGAYNEKWHYVHMMPEETVQAHIDLKGNVLHPMHWGTFDLALHAWYDPMIRVARTADSLGVRLSTPIVGETINVDDNLLTGRWWEDVLLKKKEIEVSHK